jgi:hypothetical protein
VPDGYTRSPKLLKGALVQFSAPFLVPIPNVIVFQYNPETLSRDLKPWSVAAAEAVEAAAAAKPETTSPRTQPYDPTETFSLVLELDATDALEEPASHPVAVISGVADRIAALEMLLYPEKESAFGLNISVSVSIGAGGISASMGTKKVDLIPPDKVPVVLFIWGPGRIVPVRLTSFAVEEQAFSPILYPIRAKVSVGLKVLDASAFPSKDRTLPEDIAVFAAKFTRMQKEVLAMANMANSAESILGMLPL